MSPPVKPRRRYDSSRRQEQARDNRWAVLQTARQLFLEHGFAATTMPAIASAAGVSVQTVYNAFSNKPRLAKAVFDVAIAGDDEPVPMLQLVIRDAAASDPEARAVWAELQAERLKGMTVFARALHDDGHLRPGVSADEARDVLWTCNSAELFQLLVLERGWPPERYGRWVAEVLISSLIA